MQQHLRGRPPTVPRAAGRNVRNLKNQNDVFPMLQEPPNRQFAAAKVAIDIEQTMTTKSTNFGTADERFQTADERSQTAEEPPGRS